MANYGDIGDDDDGDDERDDGGEHRHLHGRNRLHWLSSYSRSSLSAGKSALVFVIIRHRLRQCFRPRLRSRHRRHVSSSSS